MPWMITPFDGAHGADSRQDIFNLHLSRGRQVIERAFGMMLKRWRILISALNFSTTTKCSLVAKVCCALHNKCIRHAQSREIVVQPQDLKRTPFDPTDPKNGIVEKVRLHSIQYSRTVDSFMEQGVASKESKLREAAELRRSVISQDLFDKKYRRNQVRGQNRGAAYQQAQKTGI
jgi:DDE superfamily endonuclease